MAHSYVNAAAPFGSVRSVMRPTWSAGRFWNHGTRPLQYRRGDAGEFGKRSREATELNIVLGCLLLAAAVAGLVYVVRERRRAAVEAAQLSQAVAEARLADLTTHYSRLEMALHAEREARRAVDREREQLSGHLQVAAAQRTAAAKALADVETRCANLEAERHGMQVRVTKTSSDCAALEALVKNLREQLAQHRKWAEERAERKPHDTPIRAVSG